MTDRRSTLAVAILAASLVSLTGCDWFIDDLPELLSAPEFPREVRRLLFDPHGSCLATTEFERVRSWDEAAQLFNLRSFSR